MDKLFTVIKREYMTRVRTKGFIISTILLPLFILAIFLVPALLELRKSEDQQKIAVIDLSGRLFGELRDVLADTNKQGQRIFALEQIDATSATLAPAKEEQLQRIDNDNLTGLLIIPADVFEANRVEYYARNVSNLQQNRDVRTALTQIVLQLRVVEQGLPREFAELLTKRVELETIRHARGEQTRDQGQTFILALVLGLFLYMAIIIYGSQVLLAVTEEKTSRVVEVVVSSVKPFQLMAGKILGVGFVGLTQFLIWALATVLISAYSGALLGAMGVGTSADFALPQVNAVTMTCFVLYFVLGFIIYATLYAAVGSMVNAQEEAQALSAPVTMLIIVPIILLRFIISSPNATSSVILSHVPFFQPILMFSRIIVDMPPAWEIALAFAIMIGSIYLLMLLAGRIFRVGILMYGKRPTLPEVLRWVRY